MSRRLKISSEPRSDFIVQRTISLKHRLFDRCPFCFDEGGTFGQPPCLEQGSGSLFFEKAVCLLASKRLEKKPRVARIRRAPFYRRFREISPAPRALQVGQFFDSKVFRNFVDAFRAFSVCRQIRTSEMHFPTIWRFKLGNNFLIRQMISSFQTENML